MLESIVIDSCLMFKYRYPKQITKFYQTIIFVVLAVVLSWLGVIGTFNNTISKDRLVARWEIYKSNKVLEKTPNNYNALVKLGINSYILRNYADALNAYERAVASYPAGYVAWNNLGNVRRDALSFADAEKAYLEAIKINPNYIPAYINLADLYTIWPQDQEGDKQKRKILPLLQKGIKANPDNDQLQETLKAYVSANK
ncbi:tetratricopeptide repeat protein [Patescibacteria group bacterium]|nr:tetratricopeptide repeat protein [Patescibacteria group bacterium]